MYGKNINGVMNAGDIFGSLESRKRRFSFSAKVASTAKYSLYLLGVVLTLSLVFLIAKALILFPVSATQTTTAITGAIAVQESTAPAIAQIVPKTAVYYHGERLGEYEGENVTVGELLRDNGIILTENDETNYPLDELVFYGMMLNIDKVEYVETVVDTAIPYEVIEVEVQTVPKGQRVVQTQGVMGSTQKVIRTKYVNGEATEETSEFARYIEPINEEIYIGTGGTFTAPDGTVYNYSYYIDVTATAYTHTGNRTYSGTVAEVGVIAVDPRNIALGSQVYVTGSYGDYGVCSADDIGGGIKGKRIDVFLDTEEECVRFGRRQMRAYVLE